MAPAGTPTAPLARIEPAGFPAVADLLRRADLAAAGFDETDGCARAVRHVIRCAVLLTEALPAGDIDAARDALGEARAAVGAATYAVRVLHDAARTE